MTEQQNNTKVILNKEIEIEKREMREKSVEATFANVKIWETYNEENKLQFVDISLAFESDMFSYLKAHYDINAFNQLKEEKELCIEFEQFSTEIAELLEESQKKFTKSSIKKDSQVENAVYFLTSSETSGSLRFIDVLSFKHVEIFNIPFFQANEEESHVQAQEKFSKVRDELKAQTLKLKVLNNEIKKQCPFMFEFIRKP